MEILRKTPVEITALTPDLWEETLSLYREKFGHKASYSPYIAKLMTGETSIWNWKFQKERSLRLVALRENEVIGHMGALIRDFTIFGETVRGAELVEGVVKSIFQRGVLKNLITKLEPELQKLGVEFVVLFPNPYAERVVLKRATAYQNAFLMEKKPIPEKNGKAQNVIQADQFTEELESFLREMNKTFIGTERMVKYLNWRFVRNPVEDYAVFLLKENKGINGYVVLKTYAETKGHIVDILVKDKKSFRELIRFSEGYLAEHGAEIISLYRPNEELGTELENLGYKKIDWGRKMAIITRDSNSPVSSIQHWYLTMSEHSIF